MYDEIVVKQAIAIHTETYGNEPTTISYAPGRIEVLGNHTENSILSDWILAGGRFIEEYDFRIRN